MVRLPFLACLLITSLAASATVAEVHPDDGPDQDTDMFYQVCNNIADPLLNKGVIPISLAKGRQGAYAGSNQRVLLSTAYFDITLMPSNATPGAAMASPDPAMEENIKLIRNGIESSKSFFVIDISDYNWAIYGPSTVSSCERLTPQFPLNTELVKDLPEHMRKLIEHEVVVTTVPLFPEKKKRKSFRELFPAAFEDDED